MRINALLTVLAGVSENSICSSRIITAFSLVDEIDKAELAKFSFKDLSEILDTFDLLLKLDSKSPLPRLLLTLFCCELRVFCLLFKTFRLLLLLRMLCSSSVLFML